VEANCGPVEANCGPVEARGETMVAYEEPLAHTLRLWKLNKRLIWRKRTSMLFIWLRQSTLMKSSSDKDHTMPQMH
jgi:hypothetical protein